MTVDHVAQAERGCCHFSVFTTTLCLRYECAR